MAKKDPGLILNLPEEWYMDLLERTEPDLEATANAVANSISGVKTTVMMRKDRNGRPVALVALAEAKGIAMQAKESTLTRAAAAQGLDVHRSKFG